MKSIENIKDFKLSETAKEDLLEDIMDEYGERLTKLAYTYLQDWGKAQEVVQDVFVICYKHLEEYNTINSYKSWIYRVTINRCKDKLRSSFFQRFIFNSKELKDLNSSELTPEDKVLKSDEEEFLSECVQLLPVKYREAIILFYYEELSIDEMSSLLDLNPNTIKTRLRRSRDLLKKILESGGKSGR
ncbi:sigma-70 family RNA polymerase sigma factor [Bacillus sp. CGMCC 1.16607]|uniref:sigma-70 family RNA polymerase sigma factor n=1 Tax=Bacillus sp. CGMCC 1.16607 TaxID=3351842 RepID=UPI00364575C9